VVRPDGLRIGTPSDYERAALGQVVEQVVRPTGLIDPQDCRAAGIHSGRRPAGRNKFAGQKRERVLVTTLTKRMAEEADRLSRRAMG